ncbi:hypothetical protein LZC94_28490 [Pendulispora albinea]|uniref:Uncharacterized protein n=2 Tax=Pendulispora albinea TaxID=2741071 RepID=A0ABZ2LN83_9BACT
MARIAASSVPAVRRGGQVTAVFPHEAESDFRITYRPLSAELSRAASPGGA